MGSPCGYGPGIFNPSLIEKAGKLFWFYRPTLQALYPASESFTLRDLGQGGTLSWGGLLQYLGKWSFAQGWDARNSAAELYFYAVPATESVIAKEETPCLSNSRRKPSN